MKHWIKKSKIGAMNKEDIKEKVDAK